MIRLALLIALALCGACGSGARVVRERPAESFPRAVVVSRDGDAATVIAGGRFAAGTLRQVVAGEHYRDLWTTPISVPVLDLGTYAGGLTPLRQGGDGQTRSLRFQAGDGRQFVFRTVAKDQRHVLPKALRETPVAAIVQDQVSAMNPAGALVVDELAHALGVYHPHPTLVLAPDDKRLAEYRQSFAGRLGLLEEYPVAGRAGPGGVAGPDRIVSTRKLLKSLDKGGEDRVDSRAYLTARLLDLLVGDWDRHDDQWRWAHRVEQGRGTFTPLPRDRDQAFARLDGLFGRIAEFTSGKMEHFSEALDDVPSLMRTGREMDRRLLADLDRSSWDSVCAEMSAKLTDAVIDAAARRLPQPYYELRGPWLAAALKSRRDRLPKASRAFYASLSRAVDIHLSDRSEFVVVALLDGGSVGVSAYRRGKADGGPTGDPVYSRTFRADETQEVRVHLHGGDDTAVVSGSGRPGLAVRIQGGAGEDEFSDGSNAAPASGVSFVPRSPGAAAPTGENAPAFNN